MLWSISEEIPWTLKDGKKKKVGFNYLILGCKGWGYHDVLPYFKKAQTHELGEDEYRGGNGNHYTSRGKTKNPLFDVFIESG